MKIRSWLTKTVFVYQKKGYFFNFLKKTVLIHVSFEHVHDKLNNFLDIGCLLNLAYELSWNFSSSFNLISI